MNIEEIKEKYKIEPIMKEMWVWDEDFKMAKIELVLYKDMDEMNPWPYNTLGFPYLNASDTNPNDPKVPKKGDIGYFWNDEPYYIFGIIDKIELDLFHIGGHFYYPIDACAAYKNFSQEKQEWMY